MRKGQLSPMYASSIVKPLEVMAVRTNTTPPHNQFYMGTSLFALLAENIFRSRIRSLKVCPGAVGD